MPDRAVRLGWWLSSEEHDARCLVEQARLAEATGFRTAMVSDHLQPWVRKQAHAGHVWTTVGAIAQATDVLEVGTGVTAMVHRSHPITVAHAAGTAAVLLQGRLFLGVGTGERLNEQPFGGRWPAAGERREMLAEAVTVLRCLLAGQHVDHRGPRWQVESLRLWELPASPPPIYVAASGTSTARLAGEVGDGMIGVTPDTTLVEAYRGAGGKGPCLAQLHVSLAETSDAAIDNAWTWWPNGAAPPVVLADLARPEQYEAVSAGAPRDAITNTVVCATAAEPVVRAIDRFVGAGFDTVYLHQIGPDHERLAAMADSELLPHFGATR